MSPPGKGDYSDESPIHSPTVDPRHGSFTVECASVEEEKAVREGKVTMQK